MSQTTKQLAVRLPLDLHTKLVATATENNRSGHAEMLHRLEESFENNPVVAEEVVAKIFSTVATKVLTEVITGCFTKLEERVAAILETPPLYAITPADDMSKEEFEALRDRFKDEGEYSHLSDLYQRQFLNFDLRGRPLPTSPTGRLSESQPEVSGLHTLSSALPKRRLHSGGFCGMPAGELPQILGKGESVVPLNEWEQRHGKGTRKGFPNPGPVSVTVLNFEGNQDACPLTGQTWVITGSLETMTRDRAREIIMGLGGIVSGSVDQKTHAVVWGPGAGSKLVKAGVLRIPAYTEHQFIELIRQHGVDMPLPKSPDQAVAEQLS